jgi:ribonuclease E
MTDPLSQDDPWKELARDLGVEDATQPAAKAPEPATALPADDPESEPVGEERPARGFIHRPLEPEPSSVEDSTPADIEAEAFADAVELDLDDGEEADGEAAEGESAGEEAQSGEGPPGTGRKRRRRRRRRRKSGAAEAGGEGVAAAEAEPVGESADDSDATAPAAEEEEEYAAGEPDEEAEEVGAESVPLAAEEDTGGDVLRDLIATWNVPSWDEIVAGLHRPER